MPDAASLTSSRLDLVSVTAAALDALSCGRLTEAGQELGATLEPGCLAEGELSFLRMRLEQLTADPEIQPWIVRAIILREPHPKMIGHVGFHGPPGVNGPGATDAVEIGYTIFPLYRGSGYATEAAQTLIDWAKQAHGIKHFIASIAPGNAPSEAIVRKLGFTHTGELWDEEDGLEYIYEAFAQ
jgi:[ribosomal protein S5]-alanine N-acetyltransferase